MCESRCEERSNDIPKIQTVSSLNDFCLSTLKKKSQTHENVIMGNMNKE